MRFRYKYAFQQAMTIDDSESEDENQLVGNRYNNDDSDTDSEIDFYNLPSVGTKRFVLLLFMAVRTGKFSA